MSGHSKWATIKHQKGAKDKARGKQFAKLIRQVEVAAREGGGDVDANPSLRTMFQKARAASVPLDTIRSAIKRGTGELEGVRYESVTYEGYGPCGVALLVETLTDNRNRTGSDVRSVFTKAGGSMAEPGSVSWQFKRIGSVAVERKADEDELTLAALDAGAEDVRDSGNSWEVVCEPNAVENLREALAGTGFSVMSAEAPMVSDNTVPLASVSDAEKVMRLIDTLEDLDDVQNVWANFDIDDATLEQLSGDA